MEQSAIVAIISMLGTVFGSLSGVMISAKLTNYRLEQLEKKVDKHNSFAEKIPLLQMRIDTLERKLNHIRSEHDGQVS